MGPSFPGSVSPDETVNSKSAMGFKPDDLDLVTGYQVNEFTHTWSADCIIVQSQIYPGFMNKVSTLTHFPLELDCGDYAF